jgi:N-acetyl-anhydromuramyl-L-alanine amidase AmpD
MILLNPDSIKWIVLHCSASPYGNVEIIDKWHKGNGWDGIGYHYLITNAYPTNENWKLKQPNLALDGAVHKGRSEQFKGAHVRGHNWESIGICLIGGSYGSGKMSGFTSRQLENVSRLCYDIKLRYPTIQGIKGHCEFEGVSKTCPDLDMDFYRGFILNAPEDPSRPMFDPSILGRFLQTNG